MSESDFIKGGISILRNRILGNVFFRLHLIEKFGTGIRRINESYGSSKLKPVFETTENTIRITLPVMQLHEEMSKDEDRIYSILIGRLLSSSMIAKETGFGKSKVVTLLNKMVSGGYLRVSGNGRGTKYTAV